MIEKYFMTGVRFKWTMPSEDAGKSKDGSIIANPGLGATPLVYDGMDGELYNLAAPHVSTLGLTPKMNVSFSWLTYVHGHTARINAPNDILTGPMSGCLITLWTDTAGQRYVGHVGTINDSDSVNKAVKSTFAANMPLNTTGFNPANAFDFGTISQKMRKFKTSPVTKILALVTPTNEFYAILMFRLQGGAPNEWCVGGIEKVMPMDYGAVHTKLTS